MTRCRRCYLAFPTDQECRLGYEIVCPACFFEYPEKGKDDGGQDHADADED